MTDHFSGKRSQQGAALVSWFAEFIDPTTVTHSYALQIKII
jgi:hypothetical protein